MLRMVSYSHRPKSGQITCYLNRTYHVLTTLARRWCDDESVSFANFAVLFASFAVYAVDFAWPEAHTILPIRLSEEHFPSFRKRNTP